MNDEFNLQEIYHQDISSVSISHISNPGRPICVFGVLETNPGLKIKEEMLLWLRQEYDVYIVS